MVNFIGALVSHLSLSAGAGHYCSRKRDAVKNGTKATWIAAHLIRLFYDDNSRVCSYVSRRTRRGLIHELHMNRYRIFLTARKTYETRSWFLHNPNIAAALQVRIISESVYRSWRPHCVYFLFSQNFPVLLLMPLFVSVRNIFIFFAYLFFARKIYEKP